MEEEALGGTRGDPVVEMRLVAGRVIVEAQPDGARAWRPARCISCRPRWFPSGPRPSRRRRPRALRKPPLEGIENDRDTDGTAGEPGHAAGQAGGHRFAVPGELDAQVERRHGVVAVLQSDPEQGGAERRPSTRSPATRRAITNAGAAGHREWTDAFLVFILVSPSCSSGRGIVTLR